MAFNKLRINGFIPFILSYPSLFVVNHLDKLRTGLSDHESPEYLDFGMASHNDAA
jgi:hypothetical protein